MSPPDVAAPLVGELVALQEPVQASSVGEAVPVAERKSAVEAAPAGYEAVPVVERTFAEEPVEQLVAVEAAAAGPDQVAAEAGPAFGQLVVVVEQLARQIACSADGARSA